MVELSDRAHSLYVPIWKCIEGQNDSKYLQLYSRQNLSIPLLGIESCWSALV